MKDAPGFFKRAAQSARYTISGIKPQTWMSPLQPLQPFDPIVSGRSWDFSVGRNLFYNPRGEAPYGFAELRAVAANSELIRLAIETRKDQFDSLKWKIQSRDGKSDAENSDRISKITQFFECPDKIHDWNTWLRIILEELLVIDAVCLLRTPNRGGGIYSIELIDGSTIFPLIDETGRRPMPPNPAFQQILKGVPKVDYTSDEMVYMARNAKVNSVYGYSPVEQVIISGKTDIERMQSQLYYFTQGSLPDSYITAPDNMSADKIKTFHDMFNMELQGNIIQRRQVAVLPAGMEIKPTKEPELKTEFDEWLIRKICYAFSLPPTPFVKQMNRAQAESEKQRAIEEGLSPLMQWIARLVNQFIVRDFQSPDLEFIWEEDRDIDPDVAANIDTRLVETGIASVNEVRTQRGMEPVEGGDVLRVKTASGYIPIDQNAYEIGAEEEGLNVQEEEQSVEEVAKVAKKKSLYASPYQETHHI